jgi:Uma2 family endonuclease
VAVIRKTRRFTVDEYHRMGAAGILREDDRVELIEGEIVEMTPIGSRHAGQINRLNSLLAARLGSDAIVAVQNPVRLSATSELQPDVALLRPRADFYRNAHPGPADVLLIIEVADTSIEADRRVKVPLYAKAGIAEVWLLDLTSNRVVVYRRPTPEGYEDERVLAPADSLAPQAFPDLLLTAAQLLS